MDFYFQNSSFNLLKFASEDYYCLHQESNISVLTFFLEEDTIFRVLSLTPSWLSWQVLEYQTQQC